MQINFNLLRKIYSKILRWKKQKQKTVEFQKNCQNLKTFWLKIGQLVLNVLHQVKSCSCIDEIVSEKCVTIRGKSKWLKSNQNKQSFGTFTNRFWTELSSLLKQVLLSPNQCFMSTKYTNIQTECGINVTEGSQKVRLRRVVAKS